MTLRQTNIERLQAEVFDVFIVGGGINGAATAAALATQGASVALVERGDFAGQTSQESSNLVWGGIKYLESWELPLVRKLCVSRNHLIRSYPSTVQEVRFFTVLERGFRYHRLLLFLGTLLYWLMGDLFTRRPRLLSRQDIAREEPVVDTRAVSGGVEYSDAYLADNDARFVFGFVRSALDHGARAANYVESLRSEREGDLWVHEVRDLTTGATFTVRSRVLINAAGPWSDTYSRASNLDTRHRHLFSKGVHLVIDRVTPNRRVLTFFADDGRLFFAIPMGRRTCIGTTDTRVTELPASVTAEDRRFILDNINKRLRLEPPLSERDVIAERCGVRPLVVDRRRAPNEGDWTQLSRKHVIEIDAPRRRITIYGGKLTDCINVGEEMSRDVRSLGVKLPYRGVRWYGESAPRLRDEFFHQARLLGLDAMTHPDSHEPLSTRYWRRYGGGALALLEAIRQDPAEAQVLIQGTEYTRCEIQHAARFEMITELADFLRRRSKIALIARPEDIRAAPGLLQACEILFAERAQEKIDAYFASAPGGVGRPVPRAKVAGNSREAGI